jgi:hypothetical protein
MAYRTFCWPEYGILFAGTCTKGSISVSVEETLCFNRLDSGPVLSCKVSDPDWIQIQSGQWIRIRIRNPDPDPAVNIFKFLVINILDPDPDQYSA